MLKQGIVKRPTLTDQEVAEIAQLITLCDNYEHLHMRISVEALRERSGEEIYDFLYYEDGKLVGYLEIDRYGIIEKELVGMVHPEYRRRRIFSRLFNAAKDECARRGVLRLVLICEHSSQSGQAFIRAIGVRYDFSEHEMVLSTIPRVSPGCGSIDAEGASVEKGSAILKRRRDTGQLHIRKADVADIEAVALIRAASFGDDVEEVKRILTKASHEPRRSSYIGFLAEEPISTLRLDEMENVIGIYAFGVLPKYQGRGYGRQMLEEVIRMIRARSQKGIMLDVEITNTNALGLYRSVGFEIKTTYDYYSVEV